MRRFSSGSHRLAIPRRQAQRRFLDDAGHELRTPITVVRGHLELMGDDPADRRETTDQITQEEVAYYFVALALGLVNGLRPSPGWVAPAASVVLLAIMYAVGHPRLGPRTHRQLVTLDAAHPDRAELHRALERLLAAEVRHTVVLEVDLVRDATVVDVRFRTFPPSTTVFGSPATSTSSAEAAGRWSPVCPATCSWRPRAQGRIPARTPPCAASACDRSR